MKIHRTPSLWLILAACLVPGTAAWAMTPDVGWQATLEGHFHGVEGVVTVVDEDTLRVDDFSYDSAGLDVYFYLGTENTTAAFSSGLSVGPQLLSPTPYDGAQLLFDLPSGQTIADWNAISVWCVTVDVSFGDATFEPPTLALVGDFNGDARVDTADYSIWRDQLNQTGAGLTADANDDGTVDATDYDLWALHFGEEANPGASIPEPSTVALVGLALLLPNGGWRRRYR